MLARWLQVDIFGQLVEENKLEAENKTELYYKKQKATDKELSSPRKKIRSVANGEDIPHDVIEALKIVAGCFKI